MKGIPVELPPPIKSSPPVEVPPDVTINDTRLNIPEEGRKCNGVKIVGFGMLLSKLSFLEFWLLTKRIIFGQPLLFCYDKYAYFKEYIHDSLYHRRH